MADKPPTKGDEYRAEPLPLLPMGVQYWGVRNLSTGDLTLGEYETEAAAVRMAKRLTAGIDLPAPLMRAFRTLAICGKLTLHQLAEQHHGKVLPFDSTDKGVQLLHKLIAYGLARFANPPINGSEDERIDGKQTAVVTQWGKEWLGISNR